MPDIADSDILNMDDEEFLKTNPNPSLGGSKESVENAVQEPDKETGQETNQETQEPSEEPEVVEPESGKENTETQVAEGNLKKEPTKEVIKEPTKEAQTQEQAPQINFEEAYKQIMTPFKANGRTIELKDAKEAVQLMQMGANYTKKMQELVPHRKMITMLQNNGLLDEGKLAYLIDLSLKNPEAIKKLIKDSGIDPMEIDTSVEPAYRGGNHKVSDEEVAFHSVLEDMKSSPERLETIRVINDVWDQASKEALWKNPAIMTVMHEQRENGIYDRITNEVARRQTLGIIPVGTPFLQAYKVVGDELYAQPQTASVAVQPVATRVQAPKPKVTNNQRAAAVSSSRSTPTIVKNNVDYLNMSDDEFLKQFEGRV